MKWNKLIVAVVFFSFSIFCLSIRSFYFNFSIHSLFVSGWEESGVLNEQYTNITPSQKSQKLDNLARCSVVIRIKMNHIVCLCQFVCCCVAYFIHSNLMLLLHFYKFNKRSILLFVVLFVVIVNNSLVVISLSHNVDFQLV